jgi:hypothetical protein
MRHRSPHLVAGRRGEPKELTRGDCGSLRKLVAACRKVSHRAAVAQRKRNVLRKIRTWRNWGSQSRFTVTCRKITHHVRVACRKRNIARKDCTRANVVQEIWRWWTFRRIRQPKLECSKGIISRDIEYPLHMRKGRKTANSIGGWSRRQQPWLESMRKSNEVFGKTIGLEFGSEQLDRLSCYEKSRTGHCGMIGHLWKGWRAYLYS